MWERSLHWQNVLETSAQSVGLEQRENIPHRAQILKILLEYLQIPFYPKFSFFLHYTLFVYIILEN